MLAPGTRRPGTGARGARVSRLGQRRAIDADAREHLVVVGPAVGIAVAAGWLYWLGVAVVAGLLLYEHSLVRPGDLSKLDAAFFTMNGIISIAFFGFVLAERLVR